MDAREHLDALAGSTIYVNGAEYSADTIEPKTFAALRAVLDWCDDEERRTTEWLKDHNPDCECEVGITTFSCIRDVRATVITALEAS